MLEAKPKIHFGWRQHALTSRHTNQNGASLLSKLAEEPAAASGGLGGLETPDCLVNGAAPSHAPTGGNTKHTQIIEMFTVNV